MALGILALGHGGGVPGPVKGTPVGNHGNTNFALIPNFDKGWLDGRMGNTPGTPEWSGPFDRIADLLGKFPFYLIDCGPETALRLCGVFDEVPVVHNLEGIFLTHTHDDHSGGLKSLAYRTRFIEGTKPKLIFPVDLEGLLDRQMAELDYLNPTVPGQEHGIQFFYDTSRHVLHNVFKAEGFKMQAFPVDHNCFNHKGEPFPAFGYTVTTDTGKKVVFSGDTAFPIGNLELWDAELIVHDVQFYAPHNPAAAHQSYVHCPYTQLRDWTPPKHRHKVWLTHTGHTLPPEVKADGFAGLFRGGNLYILD